MLRMLLELEERLSSQGVVKKSLSEEMTFKLRSER